MGVTKESKSSIFSSRSTKLIVSLRVLFSNTESRSCSQLDPYRVWFTLLPERGEQLGHQARRNRRTGLSGSAKLGQANGVTKQQP